MARSINWTSSLTTYQWQLEPESEASASPLSDRRSPTPFPSSDAPSPEIFNPWSLDSSQSDDDVAEVVISSSPLASSPGAATPSPQDVHEEDHRIQTSLESPNDTSGISPCDVSKLVQITMAQTKEAEIPADFLSRPFRHDLAEYSFNHEGEDTRSSSGESWIEDYMDPELELSESAVAQLEFTKQLDAKLMRVLDLQARIQALSPNQDISPYSKDLISRTAGLPAPSHFQSSSKTMSQDSVTPTTRSETATPPGADGENAPILSICDTSQVLDASDASPCGQPICTPDVDKGAATPSAPKKALRHIRLPGPREEPPRLRLPLPNAEGRRSGTPGAEVGDIFAGSPQKVPTEEDSSAYSQVSGTKRPSLEQADNGNIKKRRVDRHGVPSDLAKATATQDSSAKPPSSGKFASKRASFRKAASLRSEAETETKSDMDLDISLLTPRLSSIREAQSPDDEGSQIADNCPPTQPATPIVPSERAKFRAKFKVRLDIPSSPSSPVPILAPPPYDQIPRAPMNQEEVAEARLVAMLGRELEERTADGFLASDFVLQSVAPAHADESISESDEEMDEDERQVCQAIVSRKSSIESGGLVSETDVFVWPQQPRICIDEDFRQEVMEWILDVVPPEFRSKPSVGKHLRDQLTTSPDTRWHAAQLFNRYLIRISSTSPSSPRSRYHNVTEGAKVTAADERFGSIWDIALACIALSVKFQRDVLGPFFPVLSEEFLILHCQEIEYDEFEAAQRAVFSGFGFCIGSVTPGAYVQELWDALPSLREILSFKGSLEAVKRAMWEILYDTLFELSYHKFAPSLLTACALLRGIIDTLILKAKVEALVPLHGRTERWRSRRGARCDCAEAQKAAKKKVKDVEVDLRQVLRVSQDDWDACWRWLGVLLEGHSS
ncbi:hypothetical protein BXZ70DRAFT_931861 [Cristinia sonorae]|uniref:Uncharacterized protein n=1 Tax=Cristinia sonorae TaxID=1940300 RepID=A0A8K0URJ1_9AGAR|nr:hypothetical protein BXZ70DRAFT_931861 [Cristinia sonorae]